MPLAGMSLPLGESHQLSDLEWTEVEVDTVWKRGVCREWPGVFHSLVIEKTSKIRDSQ